jgi:hypothetical protein
MKTSTASSPPVAKVTTDAKQAVRPSGKSWLRHANPISVWTRFAVLPLLALSIWSRAWVAPARTR